MKVAFFYYSSTGNTELACRYIARNIRNAQFDLMDIVNGGPIDLMSYAAVGFAAPTMFGGTPYLFSDFIERLPRQNDKPALVFNTYGVMSGQTLSMLNKLVSARGFKVIAGYSLRTPENYPPFVVKGWSGQDAPNPKEMAGFNQFIAQLAKQFSALQAGQPVRRARITVGLFDSLMRPGSLAKARREIGPLYVDEKLCSGCGTCGQTCPYGAIEFASKPVFNSEQCHGCWTCFNHCPQQAIFTLKIKGIGHYAQPDKHFAAKLGE